MGAIAAAVAGAGASALFAPKRPKPAQVPQTPKPPRSFSSGNLSFFGAREGTQGGTFLTGNNRAPQIAGGKKTLLGQ